MQSQKFFFPNTFASSCTYRELKSRRVTAAPRQFPAFPPPPPPSPSPLPDASLNSVDNFVVVRSKIESKMRLRRKQEEEEEEEEWRHPIYNLIGEIGPEPEAEVVVASTAAPTPPKLLFLPDRLESELLLLLLLMRMMLLLLLLVLSYL